MKLYRKILARYAPGATRDDSLYVYGMAAAWTAVEAMRRAGKDLTRESLLKVLDTFTATGNPFLLPGIAVKTAGKDHFPIEQMLLQRWQGALEVVRRPLGLPGVLGSGFARWARGRRRCRLRPLDYASPSGARRPPRRQPVTDGTPRLRDPQRVPCRPDGRGAVVAPRAARHVLARRSSSR